MSLASDSHLIGFVDISHLLAVQDDVVGNFPETHRHRVAEAVLQAYVDEFRRACIDYVDSLYRVDPTQLSDEQVLMVENGTRVAANLVESYMISRRSADSAACQPFADIYHRLTDALKALDRGMPFEPAKQPSMEERLARTGRRLQSMKLA